MAGDGIFLRKGGALNVLREQPYSSADVLQEALQRFPHVLAGPTTVGDGATRLLLVQREMGVPDAEFGAARWSLDHLFVDAVAVPVLVEVKRSSDRRIRREVVGQMLDYAANGGRYWPVDILRESFERTAATSGMSPEEAFATLGSDLAEDEFWQAVAANMAAGRVRLLFVADVLPAELIRIIEFLNERMVPTEVLGVELRQYVGDDHDHTVYVPRVVGRTASAVDRKEAATGSGPSWDRDSYLATAVERCTKPEVDLIKRLLDDVGSRGGRLSWGKSPAPGVGGWYPVDHTMIPTWVMRVPSQQGGPATLEWGLGALVARVGRERVSKVGAILEQIPVMKDKITAARTAKWNKWPSIPLGSVAGTPHERTLFTALDALAGPAGPEPRPATDPVQVS